MKKNNFTLVLILFFFLFSSCEKNKEEILDFNIGTYNIKHVEIGKVRLFTKDGEIFDQQIINSHVTRKRHDFLIDENNQNTPEEIQIEFLNDTTINLITLENSEVRNVVKKENIIYFEQPKISYGILDQSNKLSDFNKYYPLFYEVYETSFTQVVPPTIEYKHCIYGTYSNNRIIIPKIYISISTNQIKSYQNEANGYTLGPTTYPYEISNVFIGGLFNDFDESKVSTLLKSEYYKDTLTVQKHNYFFGR